MSTQNLLVELFVEELPPKSLKKLGIAFADRLYCSLASANLIEESEGLGIGIVQPWTWFASPRRLGVFVRDVLHQATTQPKLHKLMPVAVGLALAFRIRNERRVSVCWYGDGAAARGDAHEAMNFAGVRRLPVVFVCDNNQYAYSTPPQFEYACANLADRAAAYGFEGARVDGTDILAVYNEAKRAIEKARAGSGPTLVECVTLRMEGHAVHDDAFYVPKELLEEWAKRDPIARFRLWLSEQAQADEAELSGLEEEVKTLLVEAQKLAESSPLPDPSELEQGVYAEPEPPRDGADA